MKVKRRKPKYKAYMWLEWNTDEILELLHKNRFYARVAEDVIFIENMPGINTKVLKYGEWVVIEYLGESVSASIYSNYDFHNQFKEVEECTK